MKTNEIDGPLGARAVGDHRWGRARATVLVAVGTLLTALLVTAPAPAQAGARWVSITSDAAPVTTGTAYVVRGWIGGVGRRPGAVVVLQHRGPKGWHRLQAQRRGGDGGYAFGLQAGPRPGAHGFRTLVWHRGRLLARSKTLWLRMVRPSTPEPPTGAALLPDLVVKNLTQCPALEKSSSDNGTCFSVRTDGGVTGLWFTTITGNVGDGPLEVRAHRSSSGSTDWVAQQVVHHQGGGTSTIPLENAFTWTQDGLWHTTDIERHELLSTDGEVLRSSDAHGFCLSDNTEWRDWVPRPDTVGREDVPEWPVYLKDAACSEEQQGATSITHGLSRGWADTYPTLARDDQFIDITGLPDGTYVVRVTTDGDGLVTETDDDDNSASAEVTIADGQVVSAEHLTGS